MVTSAEILILKRDPLKHNRRRQLRIGSALYFNDAQPGITQLKNPELLPKALAAFRTFVADEHLLETYVCAVLDNSIDMNVLVVADSIMRGADLTEPVARYVDFILASLSTAGSAPMAPP